MTYRRHTLSALLLLGSLLAACDSPTPPPSGGNPPGNNPIPPPPPSGIVRGVALDTRGQPLANARIAIQSTTGGAAVETRTGADGRYRVSGLQASASYRAVAWTEQSHAGQQFCLRLGMPSAADYQSFMPTDSIERNFRWQLTGAIEGQNSAFGAEVRVVREGQLRAGMVELTLTPTGTLIDGSTGSMVTRIHDFAQGDLVLELPLGAYRASAVLIETNGTRTTLDLGTAAQGERGAQAALGFQPRAGDCGPGSGIAQSTLYLVQPAPAGPPPRSASGIALDTQGRPIVGARIWIQPALTTGLVQTRTGADGRYQVTGLLDMIPYYAKGWIERDYEGERYCLRLSMPNPSDYDAFTPREGVVRNFRWQLTGVIEDQRDFDGYYGGEVRVFPQSNFRNGRVEFTFTPTAPLVDGSTGSPVARVLEANRLMIYDIPLGSYSVTGVLVEPDGTRTPVKFATDLFDENPTEQGTLRFKPNGLGCGNNNGIDRSFLYVHSVYGW